MGLNAVVFRNADRLSSKIGLKSPVIDPDTGELVIEEKNKEMIIPGGVIATTERLGNVGEILHLRKIISAYEGFGGSVIIKKILREALHSGDTLSVKDVEDLHKEVSDLELKENRELDNFISSIRRLISASVEEENPIVFV